MIGDAEDLTPAATCLNVQSPAQEFPGRCQARLLTTSGPSNLCDCRVELIEDRTVQGVERFGTGYCDCGDAIIKFKLHKVLAQGLLPPNRRIESGVFIETEAGFSSESACGYHPSQERARPVLGVSSLFEHHFQNGKDSVETDEICQCQWTHGMIKP
jgi:hypothetical protein